MEQKARRILTWCLSVALAAGCTTSKSANPLSPTVAGPIAGVAIQAPTPIQPSKSSQIAIDQQPITLTVQNATSNGVRPLTYIFEIATDSAFATKIFSQTGVAPGANGQTSLRMTQNLGATGTYYWRSKADDGANTSDYSAPTDFTVYTPVIIQPPVIRSPADGATLTSLRPTLVVANSAKTGPAGPMQYLFEVATDANMISKVVSTLVNEGSSETSYTVPSDLAAGTRFYWRVKALDPSHLSLYCNTQSFLTPAAAVTPTPTPTPTPNPPSGSAADDQLDMSQADIINNPPDVASWARTSKITSIDFSTGYMMVDHTKRLGPGQWPESDFGVQYTLGLCFFISNQWHCSAVIQFWTGRDLEASGPASEIWKNWYYGRWGVMDGHQPAQGEMVGVWVAQGNLRDRGMSTLRERSNVVVIPFGTNYVAR
jgi:hypothetical protein